MKTPLLHVRKLKKFFPILAGVFRKQVGEVRAVDGIDFDLHEEEVLALVGESGCGKSTTARAALRLIEPTEGSILFDGQDLLSLSPKELRKIRREAQVIFQDPYASLNPRKTVLESIGESLLYYRLVRNGREQQEEVARLLHEVGLPPSSMGKYPHEFSGGQQQRIGIGRALALQPKLIICDEAVSALDISVQAQILNLLQRLKERKGLSYLFISHDLSVVRHIADRVIVMYLGKVMESASTAELFSRPKHPYTQALLSTTPKEKPWSEKKPILLKGEIPSPSDPPSGCPFRTRCPYAQPICAEPPPKKRVIDCISGEKDHEYFCILD